MLARPIRHQDADSHRRHSVSRQEEHIVEDPKLVEALNRMLAQEYACAIRYATHAAIIAGPYSETVSARLKEIGTDEVLHAEKLCDRILALGGTPTMDVSTADLKPATTLEAILAVNIAEEEAAIRRREGELEFGEAAVAVAEGVRGPAAERRSVRRRGCLSGTPGSAPVSSPLMSLVKTRWSKEVRHDAESLADSLQRFSHMVRRRSSSRARRDRSTGGFATVRP